MHPRNRLLQAFVDRELPAADEGRVREHVRGCDRCASRIAQMRSMVAALRGAMLDVDLGEPAAWARDAASWQPPELDARPRTETRVLEFRPRNNRQQRVPEPARRQGYRNPLRWAALFVFATTAIGAAALIVRNREAAPGETTATSVQASPESSTSEGAQNGGSISVQAEDGAVTIEVMGAAAGSFLYVEVAEQANVNVQVTGDLTPRFRARDGEVNVQLDDVRADVRVLVPASLRSVVILAGERVVARIENGAVRPADAINGISLRE